MSAKHVVSAVAFIFVLSLISVSVILAEAVERVIVVFDQAVNEPARDALLDKAGAESLQELPIVHGMVVLLPPQARAKLIGTQGVIRIDEDLIVEALKKPENPGGGGKKPKPPPPVQSIPWGVDRVDADVAQADYGATGSGIKVAVMDTGIDLEHPDLSVVGGYNAINPRKSAKDDNGHGTHCAGIIAALDNDIGVVGVAPQSLLYAVKVLDRRGTGYLSDVLEGIQWCIDNGIKVINMSFGAASGNDSFHQAIQVANNAGIIQVAAAGNDGSQSVKYPAAYAETIAVSATNESDQLADFSNYGPEIDFAAPGVNILSTYKGGEYKELSGTSMSTPHVSGTVVLTFQMGLVVQTGYGLQTEDDLKGEILPNLTADQRGEGLVDAEDTVNGDLPLLAPKLKVQGKLAIPWAKLKK
ncbi:MAG: S8 family peptidase [Deltaproteobacteria bacterium]|nr:S8 family peptidase [Deltaproteobacteria bacterium]